MARPLRIEFPGAIYHVSSRMVGSWRDRGDRLFRDKKDHERFRERLAEGFQEAGIRLYLFCQMNNHFHLVLETPQGNLSRFMQTLTTAYTVYYNRRHQRHGHVLDGRFKAKLVSGDEYLLRLSRYVHQNPAWVGGWAKRPLKERIAHLHAYPWSSYPSYIGRSKPLEFVDYGPLMNMIKELSGQGQSGYRRYVDSGLAEIDEDFKEALKASPCCIGEEGFRLWVERLRSVGLKKRKIMEDVTFRRVVEPLEPEVVLSVLGKVFEVDASSFRQRRDNSALRAVAAKCLIRFSGQTQREAAQRLGLGTGAAVSVQLKNLPGVLATDRSLRRAVARAADNLERLRKQRSRHK